jgi:hypothetical protein
MEIVLAEAVEAQMREDGVKIVFFQSDPDTASRGLATRTTVASLFLTPACFTYLKNWIQEKPNYPTKDGD